MEIFINDFQTEVLIDDELESLLKQIVSDILDMEGVNRDGEVSITLVDNQEIQDLNKEYRGLDEATDVLAFPVEKGDFSDHPGPVLLGDVIVSTDKASAQAQEYGHSLTRELSFLVAHGLLHLLGYQHEDPKQQKEMEEKSEKILDALNIGRDLSC